MGGLGTTSQRQAALTALFAAGFPMGLGQTVPSATVAMMRIASRESGFDPMAHNPTPPDDSYGVWQINVIGGNWEDIRKLGVVTEKAELYDVFKNARVAALLFEKRGLQPWNIQGDPMRNIQYTGAQVLAGLDLDAARAAAIQVRNRYGWSVNEGGILDRIGKVFTGTGADDVVEAASGAANATVDATTAVARFLAKLMDVGLWKRIGLGALGVALVAAGVVVWRGSSLTRRRARQDGAEDVPADEAGSTAAELAGA